MNLFHIDIDVFLQICKNFIYSTIKFQEEKPRIFTGKVKKHMLYIHYCKKCDHVHMLNGHKKKCPKCSLPLKELPISFIQFTNLSEDERFFYITRLKTEGKL